MPSEFLIIGAGKCGTTSLHHYLGLHPDISVAVEKETNFFARDRSAEELVVYRLALGRGRIRGEASPSYTMDPIISGVPGRIRGVAHDARLIYLVGDPVHRTLRAFREGVASEGERRGWSDVLATIDDPLNPYLAGSRYGHQLALYLEHFPLSAIHVVDQHDLRTRRQETLMQIFGFLGADPSFTTRGFDFELHTSRDQRQWGSIGRATRAGRAIRLFRRLPPRLRRPFVSVARATLSRELPQVELDARSRIALESSLKQDARLFRSLTSRDFPTWSI